MRRLNCLVHLSALSIIGVCATVAWTSQERLVEAPISATTDVGSIAVRAMVTMSHHTIGLSAGGESGVEVKLPESEQVRELRITRWTDEGVALAIKSQVGEGGGYAYYWATVRMKAATASFGEPVIQRFLRSERCYDVVGVAMRLWEEAAGRGATATG